MPVSTVTASGIFKQPEELRMLVASSARFQEIVGAANQLAAMEHAHTFRALTDFGHIPPYAVIHGLDLARANPGVGAWRTTGNLLLTFEFPYDKPDTAQEYEDSKVQFLNDIDEIMQDLEGQERSDNPLSTTGETFLNMTNYKMVQEPWLEAMAEQDLPDVESGEALKVVWSVQFEVEYF